ncbi:monomethylamine:corrinoid methyltransferase [bacterium]|nr:MAG: monomethylamine:corrinoid methyltransferase [bacterium]
MLNNRLPLIVERSENGPFIKESAYDLALARKTAELIRKHGIRFDPQVIVPTDDDMADRLYEAGLELFVEMGVYNQTTERRILFSREEVETAVAAAPKAVKLGMGKDACIMRHREVETTDPCIVHSGPTGTPSSERYHPLILYSCAQEPLVDCLGGGSVSTYMGQLVIPGSPTEILAVRKQAMVARQAAHMAGRPGMPINDVAVPLTCAGKMAAFDPETGLRPCDSMLVAIMTELKTSYDQLSRVAYQQSVGMHIVNLMTPLIGGMGGGAEGTAVVTIASHIMGAVCYSAGYHDMGHMSLRWSHNTDRLGLWIYAIVGQAIARNTPMVTTNAIYTRNGLGTAEMLWEVAACAIACTPCGVHQMGIGTTGGKETNHTSGLEARFNAEVTHAALGMKRQEANGYVLECLELFEHSLEHPNPGRPFPDLYNTDTVEPGQEWLDVYQQVRQKLIGLGVDMDGGWRKVRKTIGQDSLPAENKM